MYTAIIVCLIIAISVIIAFIFLISPSNEKKSQKHIFEKYYIAHRGFFDNQTNAPENTLPAFAKAIDKNYGIELDVQMTTDNVLVVFHDEYLSRMCGIDKRVVDCSYEELQQYTVCNSNERIPLLDDVLELIAGKVPLVVEIKSEGNWKETTERTANRLDHYKGVYCVESFHPMIVRWFKKYRPSVIRGQLSTNYFKDKINVNVIEKFILSNLLLNFLSKPDFIAYNHLYANHFSYLICRKLSKNITNVAWTIKSKDELKKAKKVFSVIIFDSFTPTYKP